MDIPAIESLQDGQYLTAYVLQSITKKESDWSNASTLVLYLRHCQGQLTSLLLQSLAPIYNLGMRKKNALLVILHMQISHGMYKPKQNN